MSKRDFDGKLKTRFIPPQLNWLPLRYLNFAASLTICELKPLIRNSTVEKSNSKVGNTLPDQKQDKYSPQIEFLQLLGFPVKNKHT